jgi:hypothetical protein
MTTAVKQKPEVKLVRRDLIKADPECQSRGEIREDVVAEYAEAMRRVERFPPLDCVYDGSCYWVYDGFHRHKGYGLAGVEAAQVSFVRGTREDAIWLSLGANKAHGLRRSNEDKRNAVSSALKLHPEMSDGALAEHCGVDPKTVAVARSAMQSGREIPDLGTRVGKDGKTYNVPVKPEKPSNKGKKPKGEPSKPADEKAEADPNADAGPAKSAEDNAAPDREPGDDTDAIQAELDAEKAKPKSGREAYPWRDFEGKFGALVREVDVLGKLYGAKDSAEAGNLRSLLGAWHARFSSWHDALCGRAVKP